MTNNQAPQDDVRVEQCAKDMYAYDEQHLPVRYNLRFADLPGWRRDSYMKAAQAAIAVLAPSLSAQASAVGMREAVANAFITAISNGHPEVSERRYRIVMSFGSMEEMHAAHAAIIALAGQGEG